MTFTYTPSTGISNVYTAVYTAPANKNYIAIKKLIICNLSTSNTTFIYIRAKRSTDYYQILNQAYLGLGAEGYIELEHLFLQAGDQLQVKTDAGGSVDVFVGGLEEA